MHIGPPHASRSRGATSARLRRLIALLAATVIACALAVPGAVAGPPSPAPILTQLVPTGTSPNDDQAIEEAANRLANDPMGQELIRAWRQWSKEGHLPTNISVQWFDFSWMKDAADLPDWLRNDVEVFFDILSHAVKEFPAFKHPSYRVTVKGVDAEAKPELYNRFGAPKTGLMLQLASGNRRAEGHSEENALDWMQQVVNLTLREVGGSGVGRKTLDRVTAEILRRSPRGLAGQRTPCVGRCDIAVRNFQRVLAVAFYDKGGTDNATLAGEILPKIMIKAEAELSRIENGVRKKAETQAADNLGQKGGCAQPGAMAGPRGRVPTMAMLPLAAPCGGNGSGGLAKALTSSDLGGVDFSTLQLRYMSDTPGSGVRYSFSGRPASPETGQDIGTGLDALTKSTADLRTWLVLDPSKFWVNLNPTEPDRIIDPKLGETNAGRALLEADLQMKTTKGKLIDPRTTFGARYWNGLQGSSATLCYSSRMWIVPGDVQVREDGGSLYVLKAQLAVKAVAEHLGGLSRSCQYDPQVDARGERLEKATVVPKITEAVNTAPEYAPIRRAFLARIVAQWIRNRHQTGHRTSFDHLIDSGDIGPAKLQGDWRPQQVFDSYVHSIKDGKFTYKTTTHRGRTTIITTRTFGGVDFGKLNTTALSAAQMNQQYPQLPRTAKASTDHPATAPDGSIWLGETAASPDNSLWSRTTGTITNFVAGRTGILIVLLVALGVVTFGIRGGSRRRRQTS